jgi:Arc/MetJ family transcription regulator
LSNEPGHSLHESGLRRLRRSPLLHFALIGTALYVASQAMTTPAPSRSIRIDAADIEALREDYVRSAGRAATESELRALVSQRIDDELLLGDARALGWARSDPVVQRRLIQNQRFLDPESEAGDDELLERAFAQGMEQSDIVVRRRLLERMRLANSGGARVDDPTDEELTRHRDTHR